ncbi:2Fe-2S iron-sulfur cluster-binding protein [Pseudaestuariivita atlantica]|uniref:Ferredoxin reductase n=1 Tax=Pseudaestuariivita atlantica TaxID=1317121 RepID=A0A0L1JNG8_9RHOB|nr:2Fe-2S iron-sulfur cluster-binding protein [Pseudaestuariivita atlantica]KNG93267.1 ferredoxin reductase [Pseudaestuariivita atlantica]
MAAPRFHSLTLTSVTPETQDAVRLTFAILDDLREAYRFTPGQYLTLRATIDGAEVRRSYSICSPLSARDISVGVKRIEGGAFSTHALTLKAGDTLDVMTPQGRFGAPLGGKHNYLLLAAGSGVTPILSIAQSVLEEEPDSTITLAYANRTTDQVMFRRTLDDLKDRYMTRFLLTHVMDEEAQDVELFNGRLDAEKLNTLATRGLIDPTAYDAVFICGPQPMIESAAAALKALGTPEDRIRFELFTPSTPLPTSSARATVPEATGARVDVVIDGATRSFRMDPGEPLLDAAHRAGLDLPWSCANGMCATCRCKLTRGTGAMVQNFSLEDWELERDYVLACQFRPSADAVTLDFDAV